MKTLALAFTSLFIVLAPVSRVEAQSGYDVSIDFFYDALQPYGDWVYIPTYGYCWEPYSGLVGPGWQPYTDGYWAYTDAGWTWMTDEPFGWATYHYGRWMIHAGHWCWVPGYDWAPAWVSWRQGPQYIGWAPLPPDAFWVLSLGFGAWTDVYYDIGPGWYNFVPYQSFACSTSLRPYVVNRSYNVNFISQSVNITNITYNKQVVNHIFVGGPDVNRMDQMGRMPVPRYQLRRDDSGLRNDWLRRDGDRDPRHLFHVDRGQLIVAAPQIRRDEHPGLPSRVRERFTQPEIDRGWAHAGNSEQGRHLQSLREQARRELPKNLPARQPVIATSNTPPPAVGRTLSTTERHNHGGYAARTEEVRRAMPEVRPTVPEVRPSVPEIRRSMPEVRPSVPEVRRSLPEVRPSVPEVRRSLPEGRPSVPEVRPSVPEVRPSVPEIRRSLPEVRPSVPEVRPSVPEVRRSVPEVRPGGPQQRPSFIPQPNEQQQAQQRFQEHQMREQQRMQQQQQAEAQAQQLQQQREMEQRQQAQIQQQAQQRMQEQQQREHEQRQQAQIQQQAQQRIQEQQQRDFQQRQQQMQQQREHEQRQQAQIQQQQAQQRMQEQQRDFQQRQQQAQAQAQQMQQQQAQQQQQEFIRRAQQQAQQAQELARQQMQRFMPPQQQQPQQQPPAGAPPMGGRHGRGK